MLIDDDELTRLPPPPPGLRAKESDGASIDRQPHDKRRRMTPSGLERRVQAALYL